MLQQEEKEEVKEELTLTIQKLRYKKVVLRKRNKVKTKVKSGMMPALFAEKVAMSYAVKLAHMSVICNALG